MKLILHLIIILTTLSSAQASETVKVAAIFAKTGNAAFSNATSLNGVRFAVEEINRNGGVLGKQIELIEFDNGSSAIGSKISAQKAIASGVVIAFGAAWSSHSLAMAPVFQDACIPMISPLSTAPAVTLIGNYIFRVCFTDSYQGKIIAQFAFDDLKLKTACVITNANLKYSEGLGEYFIENFQNLGGLVLSNDHYLENTVDFTDLLTSIKKLNPDIIFLPGHAKISSFIIKQARTLSIKSIFIGGDGWNELMLKTGGASVNGNYFSTHWDESRPENKSVAFIKNYQNKKHNYDSGNALGEDCVHLFKNAVERAGSFDPKIIRNAISSTKNFHGITGILSFDTNGDPLKSAVILEFKDDSLSLVKVQYQ